MSPEDKRHGTTAGHNAGCRCEPCCAAKLAYDKRRRLDAANGKPRKIPAYRVTRRVEALQALGWSLRRIAAEAGVTYNHLTEYGYDRDAVYANHFEKIDAAYRRLCMSLPPETTPGERSGVRRTRNHARRNGFLPPLMWDDIDDPDERPAMPQQLHPRSVEYHAQPVDEIVVARLMAGDDVPSTKAEREEAMRRWVAAGGSKRSLCRMHDWKPGRYSGCGEVA